MSQHSDIPLLSNPRRVVSRPVPGLLRIGELPIEDACSSWPEPIGQEEGGQPNQVSSQENQPCPAYLENQPIGALDDAGSRPTNSPKLFGRGRQVVHQIFRLPNDGGNRFRERLCGLGTAPNRSVAGVWAARHDNHIHVQHGCPWGGGRCKCSCIRTAFGDPKPGSMQSTEPVLYDDDNAIGMWEHLDEGPGFRKWLFVQNEVGQSFDFCGDFTFPAEQQPNGRTKKGTRLEGKSPCFSLQASRTTPCQDCDGEQGQDEANGGQQPVPKKQRKTTIFDTASAALELSNLEWTTSISTLLAHSILHKEGHTFNIITKRAEVEKQLMAMLDVEFNKIRFMSIDDIRDVIGGNPSFGLGKIQTREKSLLALKTWFMGQCDGCLFKTSMMILHFRDWFDGLLGKKNTILLIGPPSCAKTWVSQGFQRLGRWCGGILPWNKNGSTFIWQETVNARVISHDECRQPICDVGYLETLKQVYAGTQVNVDKKFASASLSSGAPVIATCNFDPVQNSDERSAFDERWTVFNINVIPELKELCSLPCNPMAIFDLIDFALEHCNDDPQ